MTKRRDLAIESFTEEAAERAAFILGDSSACARALTELRTRRAAGEAVALFRGAGMVLVGPAAQPRGAGDDGGEV